MNMKIFKDMKEMMGLGGDYNEEEDYEEYYEADDEIVKEPIESEEKNTKSKLLFSSKRKKKEEEFLDEEDTFEDNDSYSTVFMDPKQFEDCKKIAKHVKLGKMITINLENVSPNVGQRIMDFLAGAMEIRNASFTQIAKNVYTIVPENMKVYYEGAKRREKKLVDLERGEN